MLTKGARLRYMLITSSSLSNNGGRELEGFVAKALQNPSVAHLSVEIHNSVDCTQLFFSFFSVTSVKEQFTKA